MDSDGHGVIHLITDNARVDEDPSWSPNGDQLVFSGDVGGDFELLVARSDGTDVRQLTDNTFDEVHPTWSPDGHRSLSQQTSMVISRYS